MFYRAREANPGLSIQPFAPLYRLMLELAQGREMPESRDKRDVAVSIEDFTGLLGIEDTGVFKDLLDSGRYIPQEIINYQVLAGILT